MATNQYGKLEVTDLDFDTVKDNFKVFLKQQQDMASIMDNV